MRFGIAGFAAAWAMTAPAFALEAVDINVTDVDKENKGVLTAAIERASMAYAALDEPLESDADLFGAAVTDYGRIVGALYSEGFYGPYVSILIDGREAANIDPFSPPTSIKRIQINVRAGPRFAFGTLDVAPRPADKQGTRLVKGFEPGRQARSTLIGEAANVGVREWRDEGHAKATVADQKIVAVHPENRLNVQINLAPGPKLRFGTLTIDGDREVSDKRVRQIMGFPEGKVYSPEELRDAVNRVRRTGTFKTVSVIEAEKPNPDGSLDYNMTLMEDLPRRYGFNADYSTVDGITLGAFWLHRNLFGGAERLRIDGEVSNLGGEQSGIGNPGGEDYTLNMRLTRPGTFGADNDAFLFTTLESIDDPEYKEDSLTIGAGVTRYFSRTLYGEVSAGLRYSDVNDAFGQRTFHHAILPSKLEWDERDDPGDAAHGFFIGIDATPYLGFDGSQSGATGELDLRGYYGLGPNNTTVLASRILLGSVVGSDLDATPPDFLFFSGGGGTVRGQKYQSLGVEQPNGEISGGRSFLGLSAEVRQLITGTIGMVAFADFGYIGADSYITEDAGYQAGAGLGARVGTPIGPIRVDLATPISEFGGKFSTVELYIGIGQAF